MFPPHFDSYINQYLISSGFFLRSILGPSPPSFQTNLWVLQPSLLSSLCPSVNVSPCSFDTVQTWSVTVSPPMVHSGFPVCFCPVHSGPSVTCSALMSLVLSLCNCWSPGSRARQPALPHSERSSEEGSVLLRCAMRWETWA